MKAKATSILAVVLVSLTFLNFVLKSYTYFAHIIHAEGPDVAQQTDVAHPQTLFVPLLTFIPGRSKVWARPWVLVTSGFVQESVAGFGAAAVLLVYLGQYIEGLWGLAPFVYYVLANVVAANAVVYACYVGRAGSVPVVHGLMPIAMALLVAAKQRIGRHYLVGGIRVNHVPLVVVASAAATLRWSEDAAVTLALALAAFVSSWAYLRFAKADNDRHSYLLPFALQQRATRRSLLSPKPPRPLLPRHTRGDRSAQFGLDTFFPYPLSAALRCLTGAVVSLLVTCGALDAGAFACADDDWADPDPPSVWPSVWGWVHAAPSPSIDTRRHHALKHLSTP